MTQTFAADTHFDYITCWGNIRAEDAQALRAFWSSEGALKSAVQHDKRLPQVVMYARTSDGAIAGVCTAEQLMAPRLGQPVYYWRTFTATAWRAKLSVKALLLRSCALLDEHARAHGFPAIGILLELENGIFNSKARNAVWRNPRFVYIGRSARNLEVRVHYFRGAKLKRVGQLSAPAATAVTSETNLASADQRAVDIIDCWPAISAADAQAVIAFWDKEQAMEGDIDTQVRVQQVVAFARDADGHVAGVSTAVAMNSKQLGQPVYYYRTFIGKPYRGSRLVSALMKRSETLLQAHAKAQGYPCVGIVLELENAWFNAHGQAATWWLPTKFDYIGKSSRGLDLRIHYFDGVQLK